MDDVVSLVRLTLAYCWPNWPRRTSAARLLRREYVIDDDRVRWRTKEPKPLGYGGPIEPKDWPRMRVL